MKGLVKLFTVIACTLLSSTCKKEDASLNSIQLNIPFEIGINEKVVIRGSDLMLEVTAIADNRCPADVQCFTAGDAKVTLNARGLQTGDKILQFCIGQCDNRYRETDTVQIEHKREKYSLILSQVKPYPGSGHQKKTAVFTIKKN